MPHIRGSVYAGDFKRVTDRVIHFRSLPIARVQYLLRGHVTAPCFGSEPHATSQCYHNILYVGSILRPKPMASYILPSAFLSRLFGRYNANFFRDNQPYDRHSPNRNQEMRWVVCSSSQPQFTVYPSSRLHSSNFCESQYVLARTNAKFFFRC